MYQNPSNRMKKRPADYYFIGKSLPKSYLSGSDHTDSHLFSYLYNTCADDVLSCVTEGNFLSQSNKRFVFSTAKSEKQMGSKW